MKAMITFLLVIFSVILYGQTSRVNVKDYGARGDGKTDDYNSIQKAVEHINQLGGGTLYFPQGEYFIKPYHGTSIKYKNIEFKNLRKLAIKGNNAVIKLNGKFNRKVSYKQGKYLYSNFTTITPFDIINCTGVSISGMKIDGGVRDMTRDKSVVESGGRLLRISGSRNIILENLILQYAHTDGIYITGNSEGITATNVKSVNNARQGMSIISLKNGKFNNCEFSNTGNTGAYGSHAPGAGVDIEPHEVNAVDNLLFVNCKFKNNINSQVIVTSPGKTSNIRFMKCYFEAGSSKMPYQVILSGSSVTIEDSELNLGQGNIYPIWLTFKNSNVFLKRNKISSQVNGILVSGSNSNKVLIEANKLIFTGNVLSSYFPYIQSSVSFKNNLIVIPEKNISKRYVSLIQNALESSGNRFETETGVSFKNKVSYSNTKNVKD